MMGNEIARYNLGIQEKKEGNYDRAMKHYYCYKRQIFQIFEENSSIILKRTCNKRRLYQGITIISRILG